MRKYICSTSLLLALICGAGIAKADTCNGVSNNLVANCGFETGDFTGWSGSATTAAGTLSGVDFGDPLTSFTTPYQGTYEAYLASIGKTFALTQTLATTAGATYNIAFALLNDGDPSSEYPNSFDALFGSIDGFSASNAVAGAYMLYSFTAVATSASTDLTFLSRNDTAFFELDSVSVTPLAAAATPEPSSLVLLGTGLLGVVGVVRRRIKA